MLYVLREFQLFLLSLVGQKSQNEYVGIGLICFWVKAWKNTAAVEEIL